MVPITQGMKVPGDEPLVVVTEDGKYADTDLILCAPAAGRAATAMLQAQYVKYGPVVYQFNTPEELGAAVYARDPQSELDAVALYLEQVARDKARTEGTLSPSDPAETPDSPQVPEAEEPDRKFFEEEAQNDTASSTSATSTPEVPEVVDEVPDTTGEVLGEATTTPTLDTPSPEPSPVATTTPDEIPPTGPAPDLSTTTPE